MIVFQTLHHVKISGTAKFKFKTSHTFGTVPAFTWLLGAKTQ